MNAFRRLLLLAPALVAACAAPQTRERPAPVELSSRHFPGSVRTGPRAPDEAPSDVLGDALEAAPWEVRFEARYVARVPRSFGTSVERLARRIVIEESSVPVQPVADLARGVRAGAIEPALATGDAAALWTATERGALWPGVTVELSARRDELGGAVPPSGWDRFAVEVARRPGPVADASLEVALVMTGEVAVRPDEDDDDIGEERPAAPLVPLARVRRTERLVLDGADLLDGGRALVLPAPAPDAPGGALVIELRVDPSADLAEPELAAARDEVREAARRARENVGLLDDAEGFLRESGDALRALGDARQQRPALVFLSRTFDAPLLADLALAASDAELERFVAELDTAVAEADDGDVAVYRWLFERAAWRFVALRTAEGAEDPPPELAALLLRHAGEAGRYADVVQDALSRSASVDELQERVRAENTIFLEDGNPSARVRAFDWLAERDLAPEGYDPLAPRAERRAALAARDAALEASADEASAPRTGDGR